MFKSISLCTFLLLIGTTANADTKGILVAPSDYHTPIDPSANTKGGGRITVGCEYLAAVAKKTDGTYILTAGSDQFIKISDDTGAFDDLKECIE